MTTVLLVDDDPLQANVRRCVLERHFTDVQRAIDAAEAFILVEEPRFAERLGLVVVGLNRPGMGNRAFVDELISRMPTVPVVVLGRGRENSAMFGGDHVRFLPGAVSSQELLAATRQMMDLHSSRVA